MVAGVEIGYAPPCVLNLVRCAGEVAGMAAGAGISGGGPRAGGGCAGCTHGPGCGSGARGGTGRSGCMHGA
jgi:hypothetical protein